MSARSRFLRLLPCAALLAVGGCATVTRGTTSQIQIESEPSGASVETSLNHQCTTPCTITVSRKEEFSVVFKLPGYQDQTVFVSTRIAGSGAAGFVGNAVVGGVVGMGVDAVSGSTLEHTPNPVKAMMQKIEAPKPEPRPARKRAPKQAGLAPAGGPGEDAGEIAASREG
ncbi:MAG: PEGA domain-containing protein [Beijerinckiaceae bacterium]|nr:PEGA domain-containing protein [Beijerinckiaceae bacterium]